MIIKLVPDKPKDTLPLYDDIRKRKATGEKKHQYYIEPQIPALPEWTNKIYHCQEHELNLFKLTCSCDDQKNKKEIYTARDVRLCCKHIYYKLNNSAVARYVSALCKNLVFAAAIRNTDSFYTFKIDKKDIYYGFKDGSDWLYIFAPTSGNDENSYARYSYNPKLHRWSYRIETESAWKVVYIAERILKSK